VTWSYVEYFCYDIDFGFESKKQIAGVVGQILEFLVFTINKSLWIKTEVDGVWDTNSAKGFLSLAFEKG
jgi:hypothetical protein